MIIPITAARHGSFGGEKTCHWNVRRGEAGRGRGRGERELEEGEEGRGDCGGMNRKILLPGGEASGK